MATTDQRAGFRLPWTSDQRSQSDDTTTPTQQDAQAQTAAPDAVDHSSTENDPVSAETATTPVATAAPKKPSKFLADLTKAMQAAAESARVQTLSQFQADAKTCIEEIHSGSAGQASELRKQADDDVAAIREWSKAEIVRIREATEARITDRKAELESQLEVHAATIERRIDAVQLQVSAFESEMDQFFERLLAEQDPTMIAGLAENLPEPPPFDVEIAPLPGGAPRAATADGTATVAEPATSESDADPSASDNPAGADLDDEPTMAAVKAAFDAAAHAQLDAGRAEAAAERAEAAAGTAPDDEVNGSTSGSAGNDASGSDASEDEAETDPRITALGLADFDAAEAEAAAAASNDDIPTVDDAELSARLEGLVPERPATKAPAKGSDPTGTTQVVVVGLVSVASIASFKRHLGRVPGVAAVGVSSGPDGEFVFTAIHDPGVALREIVPSLPGFQARVTNAGHGIVNVSAHDPESES